MMAQAVRDARAQYPLPYCYGSATVVLLARMLAFPAVREERFIFRPV